MPSQLEILREQLVKSEARSGADNPFVQGIKAQIAAAERTEWRRANVGVGSDTVRYWSQMPVSTPTLHRHRGSA